MQDPHDVLGVTPGADAAVIRQAYRSLVRQHHPDRHPEATAEERAALHDRVAAINAAYRMLNDPAEYARYQHLSRKRQHAQRDGVWSGDDGVRFSASDPRRDDRADSPTGDPDFDYRQRAPSEFRTRKDPPQPSRWGGRRRRRRSR